MEVLGIDVGASGMKGAIVDIKKGVLLTERFRIDTPRPATPEAMSKVIKAIVDHFKWNGPVGCGFPSSIKNSIVITSSNLHSKWVGVNVDELFESVTGLPFIVVNDADAAGIAEINFGAGKGKKGFVLTITVGTGLGSGAFFNGNLIPNFELGQMYYKKYKNIEDYAANSVRKKKDMSFKKWGKRFNKFLDHVELIVCPDLFIIGGGGSKYFDEYEKYLKVKTPVIQAETLNEAGIIGAAYAAKALASVKF
ncbi:polyphosphate--glucose phosphotransferase [Galbibacter pacificus]|uniref:ROK family protein n=1 Tax=Galbibacter pacificus TaxID=2996052 RepID=A0ABT6FMS1_9FLAO|nr:ROK family protein [Galbibacter pacificus]MDG3580913.1 ROK family protein [Galbibacter pacificus]MDG3584391.1 ROK family protein [Galbibacter pacificus]